MAKIQETGEVVAEATTGRTVYVVKNMDVGNRDYPLAGGGTLYLPMKKKGVAWSIVSNFPEKARLDDICKYCNFTIQPMVMDKDGNLTPEEVKAPVTPKRRFR